MSTPLRHDERREHPRVAVRLSADIDTPDHDEVTAVTRDLSSSGASLEVEHPLVAEEPIRLSLFLVYEGIEDERTPPLVVGARVQWVAQGADGVHLAGVKFEHITDDQRVWLVRILQVTRPPSEPAAPVSRRPPPIPAR